MTAAPDFAALCRRLADPAAFAALFEVLPEVYLFVKDDRHRYLKANRAELALHGCGHEREMVGKTDFDFHPPALAAQYVEEDRRVLASGRPLIDQVWLVRGADGLPRWYLSSKFPLRGARGAVIGLAGVMRPYAGTGPAVGDYARLTRACAYVLAHYPQRIALADLARQAHLSASQLQREFRRLFGMTPGEYILKIRLHMARRELEQTAHPVGRIALDCGFYDQSHFTRMFRADTGLRPLDYRRQFRRPVAAVRA